MKNICNGFVYKWTNKINGKWYIGSHKGAVDDGYRHSSKPLAFAEEKYGKENFIREILFEGNYENDKIKEIEANYLNKYDAANNVKSYNQVNITGPNCFSTHTRQKMSESSKGHSPWNKGIKMVDDWAWNRGLTKETDPRIAKIAEQNIGRKASAATKRKMSISHTGKKFSEERKKNISDGQRGRIPGMLGKTHSAETRKKQSLAHEGKIKTEEHIKKISARPQMQTNNMSAL